MKRFREGFAVFFQRIYSGFLSREHSKEVLDFMLGKKLRTEADWYARGYLRYLAIAKTQSVEKALQIGLGGSVKEWLKAARLAFQRLGLEFI